MGRGDPRRDPWFTPHPADVLGVGVSTRRRHPPFILGQGAGRPGDVLGFQKRIILLLSAGLGGLVFLFLATAWFQIQSVRLGYREQALRRRIDELRKNEQGLDRRLQETLSLARLDQLAKNRYRLQIPDPSQIILVKENT